MKRNSSELSRLKSLIESDRLSVSGSFNELVETDINKLLLDYFDLTQKVKLKIEKDGNAYKVIIDCKANRIKAFGVLPK